MRIAPILLLMLLADAAVDAGPSIPGDAAAVNHALNRLTFGPRPGDLEAVQRFGLARWIDAQLTPRSQPATPSQASMAERPDRAALRALVAEVASRKLVRAVTSERQLEEVLVDFWFNHFNVFARKGPIALVLPEYEEQAIRPYILGSFRQLLGATAKSPAMLIYLDNWQSNRRRGVNENYARELLELHTLGADGGFTQDDVENVARAFTGWTIVRQGIARFRFAANLHDREPKTILGHRLPAGGGVDDGERVLDIVAGHPATARHIAYKLAQRFVSDTPPAALVERAARTFTHTNGNLREVVRLIVTSPEFFDSSMRLAKVKTPFEFVVSALRASNAELVNPAPVLRTLADMGMPLYLCQPPTGYDDTAETWVSSGALVQRINFAVSLSRGSIRGVRISASAAPSALTIGSADFQRQ
jgi:uncharacterized protein (DUF1800 family)